MINSALFKTQQPTSAFSHARTFNALAGQSISIEQIAGQKAIEESHRRRLTIADEPRETERKVLVKLTELDNQDDYDEDFLMPTTRAFTATRNILSQAYRSLTDSLLPNFINADGDGGIRIHWRNKSKEISLFCSETGELKLYWQDGNPHLEDTVTVKNLVAKLEWIGQE